MYLTHCALNPDRRTTRELVTSPQRLHAAVLGCFLPGIAADGRILWRLDRPERRRLDLYLMSPVAPSMESLIDQAGWPQQPAWRTADYRPFLRNLGEGQSWVFRLRANPVRSVRSEPRARGRRQALVRVDEQIHWLIERGERHGFEVTTGEYGPNVRVLEKKTERFTKGGDRRTVTLNMISFEGVLKVLDADRLVTTLTEGLGSGKGYGSGLMTLARA